MTATFLAMNIDKKVAAEYLRCDWHSIMSCISRVREELEPDIKTSTYTLGKAPEHLTPNQAARLEMIANTNPRLFRGDKLKEQLRLALKYPDLEEAKAELSYFFLRTTHSRIQVFKELAYKIRRHEKHILNTIETQLSNARVEAINNKIKFFLRKAYGFRNFQNMHDMILLGCSNIFIPLPNRCGKGVKVA